MKNNLNIRKDLKTEYFWDVRIDDIDVRESKRLIIERILSYGTLNEIKKIINFYGEENVINTLTGLNYLDCKTLNFASKLFNIPKKKFKCLKRKQSHHQHWNY